RGRPTAEILERLEGELDRALRYQGALAVVVWEANAPAETLIGLVAGLPRRCDSVGVADGGALVGVFPELDGDEAERAARRGRDALRAAAPDARAGVAVFPGDGADAATLLGAARDALAAGDDGVGRAERAVRRLSLGEQTVVLADPGMV